MRDRTSVASAGGKRRAQVIAPDRRRAIARQAAEVRWQRQSKEMEMAGTLRRATHEGQLTIGDMILNCAVLEDGTRVISERGITKALGQTRGGDSLRRGQLAPGASARLPLYVAPLSLRPFISPSLTSALSRPLIHLQKRSGSRPVYGVEAVLLPEICNVWLKARDAGVLVEARKPLADKADLLMRGLAQVGVVALVDEATGYQWERDQNELQRILAAYISADLLPWTKRFPEDFYRELFRLRNWQYSPPSVARPKLVGKLTAELVYQKLPQGVLQELRAKNPTIKPGLRRYHLHRFLTQDIGNPHLEKQVVAVTTLLRAAPNWAIFKKLFDRAFPPLQPMLHGMDDVSETEV